MHRRVEGGAISRGKRRRGRGEPGTGRASADKNRRRKKRPPFLRREKQPSKARALPRYRSDRAWLEKQPPRQPRSKRHRRSGRKRRWFAPTAAKEKPRRTGRQRHPR